VVDAGVLWLDLVTAAVAQGLTVPVINDFMQLSVGGTLSVGGFGGATHREGLQVDNVLELEVVTGEGKHVRCSPAHQADLFNAVLGGLGNFGIIVKATLKVVPAPETVREYDLTYPDLATFMDDARLVVGDARFNHLTGSGAFAPTGGIGFQLQAATYFSAPDEPDDAALLGDLRAVATSVQDQDYLAWTNRIAPLVELQKQLGLWDLPHPWIDLFVPDSAADDFVSGVLSTLTPADTGNGPLFLFPFTTGKFTRPFVEMPAENMVFVFSLLRFATDAAAVQTMVAANRALFERARGVGSTLYPIDAVPMGRADWIRQYGADFPTFRAAKREYDPNHVLAPGYDIFEPIP
jgi:FAD/FMN-containing dehydrogenase